MVQFCCIVGCGNRSNRDNKRFYRLPNVPKKCDKRSVKADIIMNRRKQWLMNINREDLKDGDAAYSPGYIRVCSDHFLSGKPSLWSDVESLDWAPTVMMGYNPKQRRRYLKYSGESGSKIHQNRGKVHSSTAKKRRIKVLELKKQQEMLELKTKQEIMKLLSEEEHSEHFAPEYLLLNILKEEKVEERLTERPTIHKITVDCITPVVKQEADDELDTAETEKESTDNVEGTAYKLKVEKSELQ